jgi:hypothetical protein
MCSVMCSMCRRGLAHWTGQLLAGLHLQRGIVGPIPVNFLYTISRDITYPVLV